MSLLSKTVFSLALFLVPGVVLAEVTAADLKAQIEARKSNLSGFQALLDDPDPANSLAAVELMLASGEPAVERMALKFGLTSPDPAIRATALKHYLLTKPAIAVDFDAAAVTEEQMPNLLNALKSLGGSIGPDKKGSFSFQAGEYSDKLGCFTLPDSERACTLRVSDNSLSLLFLGSYVPERWVNLHPDATGVLKGGLNLDHNGGDAGMLTLSVRLLD